MRKTISTTNAPQAIGPYVQAMQVGDFIFISGQIPLNPHTGVVIEGGIEEQTDRVMNNIKAILDAAGSSLEKIVKTTVFLADMNDFQKMNEVYGRYFPHDKPVRTTVQAARLPRDVKIEVDVIATA